MSAPSRQRPIIFYDGHCPLCNRFVKLILAIDRRGIFQFAPLDGVTAQRYLSATGINLHSPNTLVLWKAGMITVRSEAVIHILWDLPGWRLVGKLLAFLPTLVLDHLYNCIATYRYHIFSTCPLIPSRFKPRFLP